MESFDFSRQETKENDSEDELSRSLRESFEKAYEQLQLKYGTSSAMPISLMDSDDEPALPVTRSNDARIRVENDEHPEKDALQSRYEPALKPPPQKRPVDLSKKIRSKRKTISYKEIDDEDDDDEEQVRETSTRTRLRNDKHLERNSAEDLTINDEIIARMLQEDEEPSIDPEEAQQKKRRRRREKKSQPAIEKSVRRKHSASDSTTKLSTSDVEKKAWLVEYNKEPRHNYLDSMLNERDINKQHPVVYVAPSEHLERRENGLWTKRNVEKNKVMAWYYGRQYSPSELTRRYGVYGIAPRAVAYYDYDDPEQKTIAYIDAGSDQPPREPLAACNWAQFANDASRMDAPNESEDAIKRRVNAELRVYRLDTKTYNALPDDGSKPIVPVAIGLRSIKRIMKDSEVLVRYGEEYFTKLDLSDDHFAHWILWRLSSIGKARSVDSLILEYEAWRRATGSFSDSFFDEFLDIIAKHPSLVEGPLAVLQVDNAEKSNVLTLSSTLKISQSQRDDIFEFYKTHHPVKFSTQ